MLQENKEMLRIRATMPLRFLWQHKIFADYVRQRCKEALSLAVAIIWDTKVGSAFELWKRRVHDMRRLEDEEEARREQMYRTMRLVIRKCVVKQQLDALRKAWSWWWERTLALRNIAWYRAAVKVSGRCAAACVPCVASLVAPMQRVCRSSGTTADASPCAWPWRSCGN
jgi:hypothetical protein